MEKQHNRGQDGAGFASIKLDMKPGQRYISRVRSVAQQPIQDIFDMMDYQEHWVLWCCLIEYNLNLLYVYTLL